MIVLDTNVISEMVRLMPDMRVFHWLDAQVTTTLFTTTITEAELLYGVTVLPPGQRRNWLADALASILADGFPDRILPFDSDAAQHSATIRATRKNTGCPIGQHDAQIAAIARSHGAKLATRNVDDFTNCGIELINPWEYTPPPE